MSQQFSAVIIDAASIVAVDEYSEVVKSATYSNAVIQVYSSSGTGTAVIQTTSVDDPDIAGTPDSTSWYNAGAGVTLSAAAWEAGLITPICAKYLRVVVLGATIGDEVKVVITLQG